MAFIKFPKLNDKEWLYTQYIVNKRSSLDIAKELGCNCSLVRQACIKYKFSIRNTRQAQIINKTDDFILNKSVLYGTLLGDAYLSISNKNSKIAKAFFCKRNKYKQHIEYCSSFLVNNYQDKISLDLHKCNSKILKYYSIRSSTSEDCDKIYNKWYPLPDRKKVIPDDIFIDSTVLLHWFLDDGCAHKRVRKDCKNPKKKQILIVFCSESFSKEENELLCKLINEKFDLGCKVYKYRAGTGYRIKVPQSKSDKFYEIIGPPPFESLAYKWK